MRKIIFSLMCLGAFAGLNAQAQAPAPAPTAPAAPAHAELGQPAPTFGLMGSDAKQHSLADYKGKIIVLEWTNPQCPFVKKFYEHGIMQKLQTKATANKGVVWLRINSSAAGKEGNQNPTQIIDYVKLNGVTATETLIDLDGKVGHLYGAQTTPHLFIINDKGILVFAGGFDSKPSTDAEDVATAKPYFKNALDETIAGKPVAVPNPRPYGCAIKYAE